MILALLAALAQPAAFDFDYQSSSGLSITANGAPLVRGSSFEFYEPGWSKIYYDSTYSAQKVERVDPDTVRVRFQGDDGLAKGSESFHREGNHLRAEYRFEWFGDHPAEVENAAAFLWAPALEKGTLLSEGSPTRSLDKSSYPNQTIDVRRFSPDASVYAISASVADIDIHLSGPSTLFDGRGYRQAWAEGHQLWWLGQLGLDVQKGSPVTFTIDWTIRPKSSTGKPLVEVSANGQKVSDALSPDRRRPPLIPKPERDRLDWDHTLELTGNYNFPAGKFRYFPEFQQALARRFELPKPTKGAPTVNADGGVSKLYFKPGGYRINITPEGISVIGEHDEGLRYGVERLASLAFIKDGKLVLPTGTLIDEPQTDWRGVHMFVGPQAREFQRKLWRRVLLPLGFNKVVLQCERADWKALPGIHTSDFMSLSELSGLFDDYREIGVEPIPLIQSFGHMEWFFGNGMNLDVALSPTAPYAIDPRKPREQELLGKLWDEAIDLLQPKTVHFGCDEVDMMGSLHDPQLITDLWKIQLPFLGSIAKKHGVQMMIWGDKGLARGQAPDSANGDSVEDAAARRSAIPAGSMICDWHYTDDPTPQKYLPSLQLWKREGFRPIACPWFHPDNVRGLDLAAYLEQVGTLQTSWYGYRIDEARMVDCFEQFSAMVLAADYSWSARQEQVSKLGYDPAEVFRRMYFGRPGVLVPHAGVVFDLGEAPKNVRIGETLFHVGTPISLRSSILPEAANQPEAADISLHTTAKSLAFALDTAVQLDDGEQVGEIEVVKADGKVITTPLVYGHQVRAINDGRVCPYAERSQGLCGLRIELGSSPVSVSAIHVKATSTYAGLRVYAVTAF